MIHLDRQRNPERRLPFGGKSRKSLSQSTGASKEINNGYLFRVGSHLGVSVITRRSLRCNLSKSSSSHSQTVTTFQPNLRRAPAETRSRATLPPSFLPQNSALVFGMTAWRQPVCWCQKHPCTKTTVCHLVRTTSGRPGSFRGRRENRHPIWWSSDLTRLSGPVLDPPIRLMFQLRFSGVSLSISFA